MTSAGFITRRANSKKLSSVLSRRWRSFAKFLIFKLNQLPNASSARFTGRWVTVRKHLIVSIRHYRNCDPLRIALRSEEHTSELQSRRDLVCRLLLEKKKKHNREKKRNKKQNYK